MAVVIITVFVKRKICVDRFLYIFTGIHRLHFRYAEAFKIYNDSSTTRQQQKHMFNLDCTGNENHINECRNSVESHSCTDSSVLGVSCGEH